MHLCARKTRGKRDREGVGDEFQPSHPFDRARTRRSRGEGQLSREGLLIRAFLISKFILFVSCKFAEMSSSKYQVVIWDLWENCPKKLLLFGENRGEGRIDIFPNFIFLILFVDNARQLLNRFEANN